jgi:hypothetical protein
MEEVPAEPEGPDRVTNVRTDGGDDAARVRDPGELSKQAR